MPSKPGQRKRRPLKWDEPLETALQLVFEGQLTQAKIAEECHIAARTLRDWIAHPDFQAKLQEKRDALERELTLNGTLYVRKEQRIIALSAKAASAAAEYEARPWLQEIRPLPQKASIRVRRKNIDGEQEEEETEPLDAIVNESFNEAAFNAFRGALDDIAKELGHRKNVTETSASLDVTERVSFYLPQPEQPPTETESTDAASS